MFNARLESQPRRTRGYGINKRAASSRVSLLSSITAQSKRSTGSSSTITQESYARTEKKNKRLSRTTRYRSRSNSASMPAERPPRRPRQNSASDIDVFAYLVEDVVDPTGKSTSWEAERSRISRRASVQDDPDENESKSVRSRQSDSGISLNDSGYDSTSPTTYMKPRLGSLPENVFVEKYEQHQSHPSEVSAHYTQQAPLNHLPIPYPYHYEYCPPPQASQQTCATIDDPNQHPPANSHLQNALSGYDLLAKLLSHPSTPDTPKLPALYRRFSTLTHRLLLQLQDEISEMETSLSHLDSLDAAHRCPTSTPASRRAEYSSTSGRLDLLSKLHMKLEHYHTAVLRLQRLNTATTRVTPQRSGELTAYRTFLADHQPLLDVEMRFLDDEDDLMYLEPTLPSASLIADSSAGSSLQQHQQYTYNFTVLSSIAGMWLLACVPSLLSRWTFLLLLAAFAIGTQQQQQVSYAATPLSSSSSLTSGEGLRRVVEAMAWERCKGMVVPLLFWMVVMAVC